MAEDIACTVFPEDDYSADETGRDAAVAIGARAAIGERARPARAAEELAEGGDGTVRRGASRYGHDATALGVD